MQRYVDRYDSSRWKREGRIFSVSHAAETGIQGSVDAVVANLWNPSTTRSLWVTFVQFDRLSQGTVDSDNGLARTTTRGTPGTTITPDADNDWEGELTPATGAVLDHGFSATQPTVALPRLSGNYYIASANEGWSCQWAFDDGLRVPPETGLGLYRLNGGGNMQGHINFVFEE